MRLWQDPLEVLSGDLSAVDDTRGVWAEELLGTLKKAQRTRPVLAASTAAAPVKILLVPVPDLSSAEARELRTRRRYAVTIYGRAFPISFAAAMLNQGQVRDSHQFQARIRDVMELRAYPPNSRTYSYIRGVDGIDETTGGSSQSNHFGPGGQESSGNSRVPEEAFGQGQLDYVRRFAEQLSRENQNPRRRSLKAIGIIGSDVYDKLLLIQALREHFPDIVFFTTDLDARLFEPRHFRRTRNLA